MIKFKIKTWTCEGCGYKQDCEPTAANQKKHFNDSKKFKLSDIKANECPSCALKGVRNVQLSKATTDQMEMVCIENQKDIDKRRAELMAKPKQKLKKGEEVRMETDQEHDDRIDKMELPESAKIRFKQNPQKIQRTFPVMEDESDEEQTARVDEIIARMKIATPEEIQALRDKYEDK